MEFLLGILSVLCVAVGVYSQNPVLDLNGETTVEIQGVAKTHKFEGIDYNINVYLGVPFAQPPIGPLRYQKPQPIKSMDSPYDATTAKPFCVQFADFETYKDQPQSEDCLYLNIYAPSNPSSEITGRAVAIWIHGGGFTAGSPYEYQPEFLALFGDVIIVSIAYRLGPYGFLSMENEDAPGNYAFWDQHMAFQWVHDHIGKFGGDNERVTIFGESAGAMSAVHQGLIPHNKGLFQRVLAQSGSAFTDTLLETDAIGEAHNLGSLLGCDSYMLMDCLRKVPSKDLIETMIANNIMGSSFGYVIDKELIHHDMMTLGMSMDKGSFEEVEFYRSLDVLNGVNSHEGAFLVSMFFGDLNNLYMSREDMTNIIGPYFSYMVGSPISDSVAQMLAGEYTNWTNPNSPDEVRLQLIKMFGDFMFNAPVALTGHLHAMSSGFSGNYMYHFIANPSWGWIPTPEWVNGANHADELQFTFGIEQFMNPLTKEWEIKLSRQMMTYWTNFFKSGNPNMPTTGQPMWPQYDMETQSYLKFEEDTTDKSVGHFFQAKEANFWLKVFPGIQEAVNKDSGSGMHCEETSAASVNIPSMLLSVAIAMCGLVFVL